MSWKQMKMLSYWVLTAPVIFLSAIWIGGAAAAEGDADLAQELSDLITLPIQMNYDRGIGPRDDGWKLQANIQPVIPFQWSKNWNLITRTIVPVIYQKDTFPGSGSDFGLGDINMSLFLSPEEPIEGSFLWGAGPVLLFPTATESLLGGKKWGAGQPIWQRCTQTLL